MSLSRRIGPSLSATTKDTPSMTIRSKDELFQILSNSRRRYIIYYLSQDGPELSLKDLATKVAAVEGEMAESEVTPDERQRVYISLYQTHLPKLQDADVVTYDEDERTVALTDDIRSRGFFWMNDIDDEPASWLGYYLALTVASWLLAGGVALSLPLFTTIGWAGVALLVSLALTILVIVQYRAEQATTTDQSEGYEMLIE